MRRSEVRFEYECVCGFTVSDAQIQDGRPDPNRATQALEKENKYPLGVLK